MAKILLVDDRIINREYLINLLSYFNHILLEAEDGKKALEISLKEQPELIITDLLMPTMDGFQLVESLRAHSLTAEIPVIFYTASFHVNEARLLAEKCGVKHILSKPCEPQELINLINKILHASDGEPSPLLIDPQELAPYNPSPWPRQQELNKIKQDVYKSLAELEHIRAILTPKQSKALSIESEQLMEASQSLSHNLDKIRQVSEQLFTLLEFNFELFKEREPEKLLHFFCLSAKKILSCDFCAIGILKKNNQLKFLITSDVELTIPKSTILTKDGIIAKILHDKNSIIINNPQTIFEEILLPDHLTVNSFIGSPLLTSTDIYGFTYFVNKQNNLFFDNDDAKLVNTLAAAIAVSYENINLYHTIQRHAAQLQIEISDRKIAEKSLLQSEKLFRQFAENTKDVFWRFDSQHKRFLYVSPSYEEIWESSIHDIYQNPRQWLNAVIPEHRSKVRDYIRNLDNQDVPLVNIEFDILTPNNKQKTIYTRMFPLKDDTDKIINVLGIASDVTEHLMVKYQEKLYSGSRKILENSLSIQQAAPLLLQLFCADLGFEIGELWLIDPKEQLMRAACLWSKGNSKLTSFTEQSKNLSFKPGEGIPGFVWQSKKIYCQPSLRTDNYFKRSQIIPHKLICAFGLPILHQHNILGVLVFFGSKVQKFHAKILTCLNEVGMLIGNFIVQKHNEQQILSLLHFDMLTGMSNRLLFEKHLQQRIATSPHSPFALVVLDLMNFNLINETLGHAVGDAILQQVAERIMNKAKTPETTTRIGSDKFALLFDDYTDKKSLDAFIESLFHIFSQSFYFSGHIRQLDVRLGVSLYPQDGQDPTSLLKNGDIALMRAKQQQTRFTYFSPKLSALMQEKIEIEQDLRKAIPNNELMVYYQPVVHAKDKRITTVEALLRWKHPSKGFISPDKFIKIAEESDLILTIGHWVLSKVCEDIRIYNEQKLPPVKFSLNLSARQFNDPNFLTIIQQTIDYFSLSYSHFIFEITETLLINHLDKTKKILESLKALGIHIALDDFGTVYSSLSYLKNFPIDTLKIDKSFIQKIPGDDKDRSLVIAIIALGKSLNIEIIAEGVETQAQLDFLTQAGCSMIQGYYFYKPMSFKALTEIFNSPR